MASGRGVLGRGVAAADCGRTSSSRVTSDLRVSFPGLCRACKIRRNNSTFNFNIKTQKSVHNLMYSTYPFHSHNIRPFVSNALHITR